MTSACVRWGWWPTVGRITPSARGSAACNIVEMAPGDDPVFISLNQEDLRGISREDRPKIEIGEQLDAMGQRLDRRQAVFLEIEAPAVFQERRKLGLAVIGRESAGAGEAGRRFPVRAAPAAEPSARRA